jgi:DNA primase
LSNFIAEGKINEIKERVDILDIISGYLSLKKAGGNYKALCPFHSEKTPSFIVNPEKGIYHCFGCGKGGNVFSFFMEMEGLSFPEAIRSLARKYGIFLPQNSALESKDIKEKNYLYEINKLAKEFYTYSLLNSKKGGIAREYLKSRGLSSETILKFQIGFAPYGWDNLFNFLKSKKIGLDFAEKTGLIILNKEGKYYDRFRKRIIFPIFDLQDRVIAFGGRIIDKDEKNAKYINSPETIIYSKGKSLYGLNFAKNHIIREDQVIMVEGNFDLLSLVEYGIDNIVAPLGTALQKEQIELLKRYTQNFIVIFDGDKAGKKAALNSLEIFLSEGLDPKIMVLPNGYDPDSLIKEIEKEGFVEKIRSSEPLIEFFLKSLIENENITQVSGKVKVIEKAIPFLKRIRNQLTRNLYIQDLAQKLNIKEEFIIQRLKSESRHLSLINDLNRKDRFKTPEEFLLKLILKNPEILPNLINYLVLDDFSDEKMQKLLQMILKRSGEKTSLEPAVIINFIEDDELKNFVAEAILDGGEFGDDLIKIGKECIQKMKLKRLSNEAEKLNIMIKNSSDESNLMELLKSKQALIEEKRMLRKTVLNKNG